MTRRAAIISLAASIVVGAVGVYLISLWPFPINPPEPPVELGTPGVPSDPHALSGKYFQSDLTSTIYLTLLSNGTYTAVWEADVGNSGEATGSWTLNAKQVVLSPSKETVMMMGHLRALDVYSYRSNWILVATADRDMYEKHGVTDLSMPVLHFIKKEDSK